MHPLIPWELVADPLGSIEHALGTTALKLIVADLVKKIALILWNPTFHCAIRRVCSWSLS